MSTKQSIVYAGGFHIYYECTHEDICIEYAPSMYFLAGKEVPKLNRSYGSQTISEEDLRKMYLELKEYFESIPKAHKADSV